MPDHMRYVSKDDENFRTVVKKFVENIFCIYFRDRIKIYEGIRNFFNEEPHAVIKPVGYIQM